MVVVVVEGASFAEGGVYSTGLGGVMRAKKNLCA